MMERLQKIIARAGIASRRHAEQLILAGQVTVNGQAVTTLGTRADAARDRIRVAGKLLRFPEKKTYLVLNKPAGCVATMSDPAGRPTLRDYLRGVRGRVFPVGRLDYSTEGLLFLTSDGELANRLFQARLSQTYWIKVKGPLSSAEIRAVHERTGARIRLVRNAPNPWYEVALTDARSDVLRKTLARQGHPVEKMKRVKLANLELGALPPGEYRHLDSREVTALTQAAASASRAGPQAGRRHLAARVPTRC